MPKSKYQCVRCSKEFWRYPSQVSNPDVVFCSLSCSNTRTGEQRVCPVCGISFYAQRSAIQHGFSTYCSRKCSNPARGRALENNSNWKGGRFLRSDGYVCIRDSNGRYRLEHDVVMEAHIGRPLTIDENVHHINGQKADNRLCNLELTTYSRHIHDHHASVRDANAWISVPCAYCGEIFEKRASEMRKTRTHFCSRKCWATGLRAPSVISNSTPSKLHQEVKQGLTQAGVLTSTHVSIGPWIVDEANIEKMLVIEIKGCYWHSCPVCGLKGPASNPARGVKKTIDLKNRGWSVIDIWEHEWKNNPDACLDRVRVVWEPFIVGRKPE